MKGIITLAVTLGVMLTAGSAHAQNVTVGLFAPSAPFQSTAARVELANKLGDHLGKALGGTGSGRNYAKAGDFSSAVKKGDITLAVVDSAYLAVTGGTYTVIAAAVRSGDTSHAWQLVARGGAANVRALEGKRILVPSIGGRETDFVTFALFEGGIPKTFFSKIEAAPDTASTLAALGLGKADAAIVPAGVDLPGGTTMVTMLPTLPGPVLVAYGTVTPQQRQSLATAALSFKGDSTVGAFRGVDGGVVRSIARRFGAPVRRGAHVTVNARFVVGDLVEGRAMAIERTPAQSFALAPPR